MDSDFNNIKKTMSEGHEQVPPEFSWDNMKGGILSKMERLQSMEEDNKDKKPFFFIYRIGGVILMALALLLGYHIYWSPPASPILLSSAEVFNGNEASDEECNSLPSTQNTSNINPLSIGSEASTLHEHVSNDAPEISYHQQEESFFIINKDSKLSPSNLSDGDDLIPQASIEQSKKPTFIIPHTEQATSSRIQQLVVEPIAKKAFIISSSQQSSFPTLAIPLSSVIAPLLPSATPQSNHLLIGSGATIWDMGYGNIDPERAMFEKELVSFNTQLLYQHQLKRDYFVYIGMQYQQLESRLNWSTTIEDYQITLEDTIASIEQNIITGQQQLVRGNVNLDVSAQRNVQHYNRIQLYQLPIAIGKTWRGQKLQFGLFAGSVFNLYTQNTGRTIFQQQLMDYAGQETVLLKNQWKIHALLGSTLVYEFNSKWGIATSIQAQKSIQNWSREQHVDMRPTLLIGSIGLSYRL